VFVWGTAKPCTTLPFPTRNLHCELLLPEGRIDLAVLDLETWLRLIRSDLEKLTRYPYRSLLLCFDFGLLDDNQIRAVSNLNMTPLLFSRVNQPLPCGRGSVRLPSRDRKGADAQLFLTLCLATSNVEIVYSKSPLRSVLGRNIEHCAPVSQPVGAGVVTSLGPGSPVLGGSSSQTPIAPGPLRASNRRHSSRHADFPFRTVPGSDFSPQQLSWEMGIPPRSGMSNGLGFSQAPATSSSGWPVTHALS
jgi:hypothetical protein